MIYAELELAGPQQKQQLGHHHHHLEGLATLPPHRLSNNNNNTTTTTSTTTNTAPHHPHSVVYATLDHKRLEANCSPTSLLHRLHHHTSGFSQQHQQQQQSPLSGPNTPTHSHATPTHSHITPAHSHATTPAHLHTTPTHSHTTLAHLQHTTPTPPRSQSHPGPSSGIVGSPPWTPSPTRMMDRRYKQRRDTHCGSDTEASTPLINPSCQKESSV